MGNSKTGWPQANLATVGRATLHNNTAESSPAAAAHLQAIADAGADVADLVHALLEVPEGCAHLQIVRHGTQF